MSERKNRKACARSTTNGVKWNEYERQKADWLALNRQATPQQYTKAMLEIARRLGI